MWTTYSGHLYAREQIEESHHEEWQRRYGKSEKELEEQMRYEIENELIDDPLPWEEEDEYVKGILQRDGIYSVPLGDELEEMIRQIYKEAK